MTLLAAADRWALRRNTLLHDGRICRAGRGARTRRGFPAARFEPISRTAAYLAAYDQVAWTTTDSLIALVRRDTAVRHALGAERFAYEQDSTWHAVYGRYDKASDRYVQAAHFAARRGEKFRRQATPADSLLARRYGRALSLTAARLPAAAFSNFAPVRLPGAPVALNRLRNCSGAMSAIARNSAETRCGR